MPSDTPAPASPTATEMALLACPFCGEDASIGNNGGRFWGRCNECGVFMPDVHAKSLAVSAWNRRATPDLAALRAQRDRLREALAPFAEFAAKVEARYRKRGGDPDAFPDTHPFADVTAADLTCGVWRAARAALAEGRADG